MAKEIWEIWIENEKRRQKDFEKYLKSKKIKPELELKEFIEGAIVSAYYSIYHASLALCALKGYSTKDHLATLLILIKEFYKKQLDKEEIEMVSKTTIEKGEVLYYIEAKSKRTKASYSTKILFDEKEAEILQKKAIGFVNKVKEIIDSNF